MNENQNIYVRNGRTTSRVLNRPGGTCQITLGGYTKEELERMRKKREAKKSDAAALNASTGAENETKATTNEKVSSKSTKGKETASVVKKSATQQPFASGTLPRGMNNRVSSNAFASSSTTNSYNVLTDRPTSRVSNPPGGRSNFKLC